MAKKLNGYKQGKKMKLAASAIDALVGQKVQELKLEQERLLKERLSGYLGYEFDLEAESKKAFPRLRYVSTEDGTESYYWNDGTEEGYRVVTFKMAPIDPKE